MILLLALLAVFVRVYGIKCPGMRTTSDILGPKYIPNAPLAPFGSHICSSYKTATSTVISIQGRILDAKDCVTPIPSTLEIWQTNIEGVYSSSDAGLSQMDCRRTLRVNETGQFQFDTFMPGHYDASDQSSTRRRPSHIHIKITPDMASDQNSGFEELTTQIYFRDDADRMTDACSVCQSKDESLILDLVKSTNTWHATWNAYL